MGAQTNASADSIQPINQAANIAQRHRTAVAAHLSEVYRVLVQTDDRTRSASAFLASGSRIVATNHHVIDGGRTFQIGYVEESGRLRRVPLRLLASFPQKDLALLEAMSDLPGQAMSVVVEDPEPASDLFAIGFPAAADVRNEVPVADEQDPNFFRPSVVRGAVSRIIKGNWQQTRLQHQTPISVGYSGGPLLNDAGAVVGISTSISNDANGISYGALGEDLARLLGACGLPVRTIPETANGIAGQKSASLAAAPALTDIASARPEHEALRAKGYRLLREGNVAAARATFELLASRYQLAEGYAGLAATYDPNFLRGMAVVGLEGDFAKAGELYAKARSLGGVRTSSGQVAAIGSEAQRCQRSLCILIDGGTQARLSCEPAPAR
ncbi:MULTISPECIES: serine protease [Rhodomicrobium]|uniref:S1 family peptidase n=1 Tax=Rhodomicrobium TaxID=1068 RepID=UPI0014833D49|nr:MULTISPECIES: serine protease [Rhodomicrobium]